ncbi:hypothetical protein QFZ40_001452 [Arthrobacter pascens]|uniref:hypothetical protein n=1 Tax=Arthrobacter pascens TaxID=1677 RepID=UPI00278AAC4F|nr:hypothetical protein [Arthrobacter pascens]MDQ0633543.1 hypothetical protein [Arthrobacter pascens]
MENTPDGESPLVPAPRHLRRRRLGRDTHGFFPVSVTQPVPLLPPAERPAPAKRSAQLDSDHEELIYRRKRFVALLVVILVAISVPALIIALVFLG